MHLSELKIHYTVEDTWDANLDPLKVRAKLLNF